MGKAESQSDHCMNLYTEDYYLRGQECGLSNYRDYHWLPDQTISMVSHLRRYLRLKPGDTVMDVGCARGFYVKAMRMIGLDAWGYDISEWAISNCHPDVKPYLNNHLNGMNFRAVVSKDCFEHIPPTELSNLIRKLILHTDHIFVIVPLAKETGGPYVHPKEENDKTHVNRWTLPDWLNFLSQHATGFVVNGSYSYPGLKPGCYEVDNGYGFFNLERA